MDLDEYDTLGVELTAHVELFEALIHGRSRLHELPLTHLSLAPCRRLRCSSLCFLVVVDVRCSRGDDSGCCASVHEQIESRCCASVNEQITRRVAERN